MIDMRRVILASALAGLILALAGCATTGTKLVDAPEMPALSSQIADPCPPLSAISDTSLAALVQADADASLAYAECRSKHKAAVAAYNAARNARAKKAKR